MPGLPPSASAGPAMGAPATIWELPTRSDELEGLDARGAPDPAYAHALGLREAPLGRRSAATLIDLASLGLTLLPFLLMSWPVVGRFVYGRIDWYGVTNHPDLTRTIAGTAISGALVLILVAFQIGFAGAKGWTIGKLVVGVRVVDVRTLVRPGVGHAFLRGLTVWGLLPTLLVPIVVIASSLSSVGGRRRGWHDRIAQTWLVDVRRGLNPYDEKRLRLARKMVAAPPALRLKTLPSLVRGADAGYHPGPRTSAGVLGAARPHPPRTSAHIGLTGLVPEAPAETKKPAAQFPQPAEPRVPIEFTYRGSSVTVESSTRPMVTPARTPTPPAHPPIPSVSSAQPASGDLWLRLDVGLEMPLSQPVLLGRQPEAAAADSDEVAVRVYPMEDPSLSVSKTHVLLRPGPGYVEVIDQGSKNGTSLLHEGQQRHLAPGAVGIAAIGDSILFGDRSATVFAR